MRFAQPEMLMLLWLVPVLVVVVWFMNRVARKRVVKAFGDRATLVLGQSVSSFRRRLRLILLMLALACFAVALARPQLGKSTQEVKMQGVELMLVFDVSTSMLAEDVKPSRLEHAKSEMMRLMDLLSGDKVGLIAFAGSATAISPLTTDKSSLKMFIESLSPESVENQGTNFKGALDEAREAFERGGEDQDDSHKITRAILLVSDGEDHEPAALDEARKLANDGIRIFSLAFGTEKGAPIPLRDERGFLRSYKRDKKYKEIITQVHGDFLRELAEVGKGSFHHATFGGREAALIKDDLDKLQKSEFASSLATSYDERFQIPLAVGLALLFLSMLIGERRSAGRVWRGRFEVTPS
jgi:Ca-activated chloride channel family protein